MKNGVHTEPQTAPLFPKIEEQSRILREAAARAEQKNEQNDDIDEALGGYSCDWLMKQDLPETQFVVNQILPVGYTVLGGRPKQGKSILTLGSIAVPVAIGGKSLGYEAKQGTVLSLCYEDTPRRLKERLQRFTQYDETPPNLSKLRAYHNFPRAHEKGLELLERLLDKHTDTKLVVIDTLPRFAPPKARGESDYDSEYNLGATLFRVAHERQIAIVSIVHTTKSTYTNVFDNLRGSGGTAAADVLLVLERTNDKNTRILHGVGRDTEETRLEIHSDSFTLLFSSLGEADDERYGELTNFDFKASISDSESKKTRAIEMNAAGKSYQEIAETLSIGKTTVHRWLKTSFRSMQNP